MNRTKRRKCRQTTQKAFRVLLCIVFCISMNIFLMPASMSHATTTDTGSSEGTDTSGEDGSTDEDGTTEYKVTTEYPDDPTKAPDLVSNYAIVMDADTGAVLYQKNAYDTQYPASITKIMTFLLAMEHTKLTDTVTMSYDSVYGMEWNCSRIGLDEGEQISMEDALYAMMLESANEVAWGIGETVAGGSITDFANMMNERAKELGCQHTHFVNANGLPDDNHYTTCYDMALITKACLAYDDFRTISGTRSHVIEPTNICEESRELWQHCKMTNADSRYYYEYCEGGKTGYTDDALNTLVTWSKKGDTELICVLMNCNGASNTYTDSIALYNYCFNNYQLETPLTDYAFDKEQQTAALDYLNNYYKTDSTSEITLHVDNTYQLDFNKNEDISKLTYEIEYKDAPVKTENTYTIGSLVMSYDGLPVGWTDVTVTGYDTVSEEASTADVSESMTDAASIQKAEKKHFTIKPLLCIIIVLVLVFVCFITYVIHVNRTRKLQRIRQAERRRQYEAQKKQQEDLFDLELAELLKDIE